mgnify:CR=1 FL=1
MLSWIIPNFSAPPADAQPQIINVADKSIIERIWLHMRYFAVAGLALVGIPLMLFTVNAIVWYVVILVIAGLLGELYSRPDYADYKFPSDQIFYPLQYFFVFTSAVGVLVLAWRLGIYHGHNFLWLSTLVGEETVQHIKTDSNFWTWAACFFVAAAGGASNAIIIGHELTHRTESDICVRIGRFGEIFGQYTSFGIKHPYGHHNVVATPLDSSTAMRGSNFYAFASRSILGQYVHAWELERDRLGRKGKGALSAENRVLMGWVAEAILAGVFIVLGGWAGLLAIFVIRAASYVVLELANYIEHYGLVRVPAEPQQLRHASDAYRRVTTWGLCAINRHANHHNDASVEFWDLKAYNKQGRKEVPIMFGDSYLFAFALALCPPLWNRVYNPRLIEWDLNMANDAEKGIAYWCNIRSGQKALIEHAELNLKAYADKAMA